MNCLQNRIYVFFYNYINTTIEQEYFIRCSNFGRNSINVYQIIIDPSFAPCALFKICLSY